MLFIYKAKSNKDEIVSGKIESADRFSASRDLHNQGLLPIKLIEQRKYSLSNFFTITNSFLSKVSTQEKIILTKNLSGMLKAGLPISRCLSVLQKQTRNSALRKILFSINEEIDKGASFSDGLEKFPKVFSDLFISMVRAGEESGNLVGALTEIGANLQKSHSLTKKIKGALFYPAVIFCAMILIGILMFAFVVPTLAKTFKNVGVSLPASTRLIISLGNFFSNNLALSLILAVVLGFGLVSLVRAKFMAKYVDFIVLRLPMISVMSKEINTARTARTISSLLVSGVSIVRALEISKDVVQNVYYKKILDEAKIAIEKGEPLSEIFRDNSRLYPIMMSEMMQVGEETGKLSDMLLEIALFYENEVESKTKNLSTIIEPILMLMIGGAVGFFAVSMISPIYSVMDKIK
jgi:type IV pilus assembly protein PilC